MNRILAKLIMLLLAPAAFAMPRPVELHQRLNLAAERPGSENGRVNRRCPTTTPYGRDTPHTAHI